MPVLNIKVIMWSKYITWNYAREITAMLVSISSKKLELASFQNFWYKKYRKRAVEKKSNWPGNDDFFITQNLSDTEHLLTRIKFTGTKSTRIHWKNWFADY